jgi:RNA polymerase sigma factor (sigma-70 family)
MTDLDLLQRYAQQRSEEAFATLVDRHLNFVYATALRQVRSPQLAEEVAQSVFMSLARNSNTMKPDTVLTAWLYCVTRHAAIDLLRGESRRQAREQAALEIANMKSDSTEWAHVEPFLDEALEALDETDRSAILLRYFENKSLREVGENLGTSEDAAQKRVSRTVEQLRACFSSRGVVLSAAGLTAALCAQATQAAPIGLCAAITTAAALAGPSAGTAAFATATKTIAMTTLQKTLITATIIAAVGAGIYEARQASNLQNQVQTLQQRQAPLTEQVKQLQREHEEATRKLAALREDNELLQPATNTAELLKLRGEVGVLRRQLADYKSSQEAAAKARQPSTYQLPNYSQADLPRNFPQVSFVYSGHSNPESTLLTLMWAFREGNMRVIMNTLAPEAADHWQKLLQAQSADEIPEKSIKYMENVAWFDLTGKRVVSDKEVQLTIAITPPSGKDVVVRTVPVKNVRGEWRVGDLIEE